MKEFMEEYGGVIVTCMLGIMLLGLLYSLLASGGQLHRLAELFFDGIGIKMSGGQMGRAGSENMEKSQQWQLSWPYYLHLFGIVLIMDIWARFQRQSQNHF